MEISVKDDLLEEAVKRRYDIIREAKQALADIESLTSRVPSSIVIQWGSFESPFAKYDVGQDQLTVHIFPNLFDLKYGGGSPVERDIAMRGVFNHEFLEAIRFSPAGDGIMRVLIAGACAFNTVLGCSGFDKDERSILFDTPEGVRLMVDQVSRDIRTDRHLVKNLAHYAPAFSLSQRHYIEVDWIYLNRIEVTKTDGKFYMNVNPFKVVHQLVPAMRRSIVMEEVRKMPNQHTQGYLGRFTTLVKDWVINRKIRHSPLKEPLYRIYEELEAQKHNKTRITRLANEFVKSFELPSTAV